MGERWGGAATKAAVLCVGFLAGWCRAQQAPARRSAGISLAAWVKAVARLVLSRPGICNSRTSRSLNAFSCWRRDGRRCSICALRPGKFWLALSSTTRKATSGTGRRRACSATGLQSRAKNNRSARLRQTAPRARVMNNTTMPSSRNPPSPYSMVWGSSGALVSAM